MSTVKLTKEYKLQYEGKESKASILANTLEAPFQEVRVFNENNSFDDDWRNMLIFGDNLMALKTLYEDMKTGGPNKYKLKNKIKLIYIDPPFATKQDFMKDKEKAYSDKVKGSEFIEFLRKRLIFLREILADDGSIYVHLDWKKGHYIKTILDEVFGEENFVNEIIWAYKEREMSKEQWNRKHDIIFMYSKTNKRIFNWKDVAEEYSEYTLEKKFKLIDEFGEKYRLRYKDGRNDPLEESEDTYRQYLKEGGVPPRDWWTIPILNQAAKEKTDFPTQKPEILLERMMKASSNRENIILDAFAGSGTTLAVAEKLNRKWIGMDCGKLSIYTIQKRMLSLTDIVGSVKEDDRDITKRIENKNELLKSKAMLIIGEKGRANELIVTEDFLHKLHNFLKELKGMNEFSISCPEEKFKIEKYDEDENGIKIITIDHIIYKISFIEPKEKKEKEKPLKAKSFVLFNAGIYDSKTILNLNWKEYRDFVLKLFEVREDRHKINGFDVDGYIGVYPAYIWNYPDKKNLRIDTEYVESLHKTIRGRAGEKFYFIAPVVSFNFMQDEIKIGDTVYTFLKVPVSVLIRLIQNNELGSFKQPKSDKDVNDITNAIGFDFISQPIVEYKLSTQKTKGNLFEEIKYIIELTKFKSDGLLYSEDEFENFETLSMILIDYDYEKDAFVMDEVLWAKNLVKENSESINLELDANKWMKEKSAIIFIDIYGNEKKLIFNKKDFNKIKKNKHA